MSLQNYVRVTARVGDTPRFYDNGKVPVARMRVATNTSIYNSETGKRETRTDWHNAVAFGRTAENIHQYVDKGWKVDIEGEIRNGRRMHKELGREVDDPYIRINEIRWEPPQNHDDSLDNDSGHDSDLDDHPGYDQD